MEELCHFFVKIIPLLVRNHIKIFYIEEGEDVLSFMRRKKPSRKSITLGRAQKCLGQNT